MCKKKGILLVSFLVYLMLFSMVTFFINHLITQLIIPSFSSLTKSRSIISLHIASDIFVRDAVKMQQNTYSWKVISAKELVWQVDDRAIGWYFSKNTLKRKEGTYNGNWHNVKKSIIAKDLIDVVFIIKKDKEEITAIELRMKGRHIPEKIVTSYISIRKKT